MSRLVILILLLLFLTSSVSATYYIKQGGFLYEVGYSVFSNGTSALIDVEVDNYGITCGMMENCWAEVYDVYDNLLYYNGSTLYLLNLTPALEASLPSYAPKNITYVYFNWVYYANGSWYVNVSLSAYSPETVESFNKKYVYHLNLNNFCVEQSNVSLAEFPTKGMKETINGWKIVVPHEFRAGMIFVNGTWIKIDNKTKSAPLILSADFFVGASSSVFNSSYVRPWIRKYPHFVPNSSKFPVYFVLTKDDRVKNVTFFYINTTSGLTGFWLPKNVKIVNLTVCKIATTPRNTASNETTTQTTVRENTTPYSTNTSKGTVIPIKPANTTRTSPSTGENTSSPYSSATKTSTPTKKSICGPAFLVLLATAVLVAQKVRRR